MKDSLKHYASEYYDPVKAHEYYEQHKQLKGRRSTAKLDDEGKEIWQYTKDQITERKKADIQAESDQKNATIEQHRAEAKATRERISQRLKQLNAYLKSKSTKGLSAEERERVTAEKAQMREEARADAASEREKVASDLKSVCEAAREAYKKAKEDITSSYEEIYQEEYDKILSEHEKQGKGKNKNIDERARKQYVERGLM